jgi:gluconolactonase
VEAICPEGVFPENPVPANTSVVRLCEDYDFTFAEGPAWIAAEGALFFSDFEQQNAAANFNGDIVRYVPGGNCETHIPNVGTNGLAITLDGKLLGASHLTQTVDTFDVTSKARETLIGNYNGEPFGSPNDVTVRSDGSVYFTDPAWEVGNREEVLPQGAYFRDVQGTLTFIEPLPRANGITLSLDESKLYVAGLGSITQYDLADDGTPSNPSTFVNSGSDGMVLDCAGNLYLTTNNAVVIYNANGEHVADINVGANTTNVAFGGAERKTLYITGRDGLRAVELSVPGFPY